MTEPWLTKKELAAELKVSVRTIERLRIPATKVGHQNRYIRSEVESFLRGDTRPAEVIQFRRPEVVA